MGQAREMKALLALSLLLLCTVLTVTGRGIGASSRNPCTNGMKVVQIFIEERSCSPDSMEFLRTMTSTWGPVPTVEDLQILFTAYCRFTFPSMKQCFLDNMRNCPANQRDYLRELASETGFVCQPNSTLVHPNMLYVLSQLSDPSEAVYERCPQLDMMQIYDNCSTEAARAIGLSSPSEFHVLDNYSIRKLAPMVSKITNSGFECILNWVRESRPRCPEWRWQAVMLLRHNLLPTVLGRTMAFTQYQLADMFEFPRP